MEESLVGSAGHERKVDATPEGNGTVTRNSKNAFHFSWFPPNEGYLLKEA